MPEGWDYLYKFLTQKEIWVNWSERVGLINKTYDRFRNRWCFLSTPLEGQVLGFAGRLMPDSTDKSENMSIQPETEIYLNPKYSTPGYNQKWNKLSGQAVVVEGEMEFV